MNNINQKVGDEIKPRLIIWQLTPEEEDKVNGYLPLDLHESLLILDSIARTAKPIIVLKGSSIIKRDDISEIAKYGYDLELKMIIEIQPEDLNQNLINNFHKYGSRIFRLNIDGCVNEDIENRFKQTSEFLVLENAIELLKTNKLEVHLSVPINKLDHRSLAYNLDYAYSRGAKGLYFYLRRNCRQIQTINPGNNTDDFLQNIPCMKEMIPCNMYFSPQCVKYTNGSHPQETVELETNNGELHWMPVCLAGKTYCFISADGKIQFCPGMKVIVGDLREYHYDFKSFWLSSEVFNAVRVKNRSCSETRIFIEKMKSLEKLNQIFIKEKIGDMQ